MHTNWRSILQKGNHLSICNKQTMGLALFHNSQSNSNTHLSICLERHAAVTCQPPEIVQKFSKMLKQVELENSLLSNYELEKIELTNPKKKLASRESVDAQDANRTSVKMTVKDIEEHCIKELQNLKTLLSANEKKDKKSQIKDCSMFLVTKQITPQKELWLLPEDVINNNESIVQEIKRIVESKFGKNVKVSLYGNVPFWNSSFQENSKDEKKKTKKIIYVMAKYLDGPIECDQQHQWMDIKQYHEANGQESNFNKMYHLFHFLHK